MTGERLTGGRLKGSVDGGGKGSARLVVVGARQVVKVSVDEGILLCCQLSVLHRVRAARRRRQGRRW